MITKYLLTLSRYICHHSSLKPCFFPVINVDAGQLLQERDCFTCKSLAECFPRGTTQAQIGRESHAMISCMVKSAFRGKNECEGLLARTSCLTDD